LAVQRELWKNDDVVLPDVGCIHFWCVPDILWYQALLQRCMARCQLCIPRLPVHGTCKPSPVICEFDDLHPYHEFCNNGIGSTRWSLWRPTGCYQVDAMDNRWWYLFPCMPGMGMDTPWTSDRWS